MAKRTFSHLSFPQQIARTALTRRAGLPNTISTRALSTKSIQRAANYLGKNAGNGGATEKAAALLNRLTSKRIVSELSRRRSPANKLARTILKRGVDPRALRDKLGKSAIENMGYMGFGSNNPKKAASRAMKAATVERAMRIADRTARVSRTAHQTAIDNFKKNAHLFGPGGQRIRSK